MRRYRPIPVNTKNIQWLIRRHRSERRFATCGFIAILVSLLFLSGMLFSVVKAGYTAFVRAEIKVPVVFSADVLPDAEALSGADYRKLLQNALFAMFPEAETREQKRNLSALLSKGAAYRLREMVMADPSLVGQTRDIWLPASGDVDLLAKRGEEGRLGEEQVKWLRRLQGEDRLETAFNVAFFTMGDSQEPELAGVLGSLAGSFFTIFISILCAFPLGVATAIYLEELSRKSWFTEVIEININNLAAVPSIIYGLLGLAVYINYFSLPRSSSLVGGLVLALIVLPVIVIATRNALRTVPKSIRFAALAMGATPLQVVMHHTFPYALPGVMTGVILSIARALGETSPLLMIGMVAFVTEVPHRLTDPATSLPVQIYLWSNNPEAGFVEKTAAAIIILLGVLAVLNAAAAWVRRRYEIKW